MPADATRSPAPIGSVGLPDFDDDETVIDVRDEDFADEPPPLPFTLQRVKSDDDWLEELGDEARAVLERARTPMPNWPLAPRVEGAVAVPKQRIPSLREGLERLSPRAR